MDQSKSNPDLSILLKKIADKAKEDGEITADEYGILEKLSFDVAEYLKYFDEAQEDGTIDNAEQQQLLALKKKIVFNAMGVASKDGIVTDDEFSLINEIVRLLKG